MLYNNVDHLWHKLNKGYAMLRPTSQNCGAVRLEDSMQKYYPTFIIYNILSLTQ